MRLRLGAHRIELNINIPRARRVRRRGFFRTPLHLSREIHLRKSLILDAPLYGEIETTSLARCA